MKTLREDWKNFKIWEHKNQDVRKLEINGLTFFIEELETGFSIGFDTPFGRYSEPVQEYKDIYDALGHIFCEESGILDNMINK